MSDAWSVYNIASDQNYCDWIYLKRNGLELNMLLDKAEGITFFLFLFLLNNLDWSKCLVLSVRDATL